MRIAIVYDCLFPNTVGGAERWYRNLAERLDGEHRLVYLTHRQWGDEGPETSFPTLAVSPGGELYTGSGRRRIWPPVRFGIGVLWHVLRHGRRYDAIHMASFPYFSLLGAWLALRLNRSGARLIVDWHEIWSLEYWQSYLGRIGGRIAYWIQALCLRLPDRSFTFSRLAEVRARELGHRAPITRLTGEYAENEEERRDLLASESPAATRRRHWQQGARSRRSGSPRFRAAIAEVARAAARSALRHPRRWARSGGDPRGDTRSRAGGAG